MKYFCAAYEFVDFELIWDKQTTVSFSGSRFECRLNVKCLKYRFNQSQLTELFSAPQCDSD